LLSAVAVALLAFAGVLLTEAGPLAPPAQSARDLLRQKEEVDEKPTKKVEEVDDKVIKRKVVVDDDKPAQPTAVIRAVDLAAAARDTKNKAVKELFEKFSVPGDYVERTNLGGRKVRPLPMYVKAEDIRKLKAFEAEVIDESGNSKGPEKMAARKILYYEEE